ncbi:MAG: response regulator [Thiobacillaceae bacterium]|nr:response regulator [Thiobacillaceae bacterium]
MSLPQDIKVLLADDIAAMRGILKKTLRPYGLTNIDEASNGEDALDKYKLYDHELVMLDINMPIKNGIEVLRAIKALKKKPYSTAKIDGIIQKFNQHRLERDPDAIPLRAIPD